MAPDWEDETKVAADANVAQPITKDRDRAYLIVLSGSSVGEMYKIAKEQMLIGRSNQADIYIVDDGISRRHAEVCFQGGQIVVRDLGSTNGTFCNGRRIDEHILADGDKIQVGSTTILKFTFHDSLDETFQRQMYESALRDGLTKIFNKKYFLDRLESEVAYCTRHQSPMSLILFDIDHFKAINDSHGHLAGDVILATLASVVSTTIRQEDVFARFGGEEFAIICRGIDLPGALAFAERIRKLVATQLFTYGEQVLKVTISIGVATVPASGLADSIELVAAADQALYQAKRAGRDQVVAAS